MKNTGCLLLFLVFAVRLCAQDQPVYWDTLKYQKFRTSLIVGIFQSYRNFNNDFEQYKTPDSLGVSKTGYRAESRLISGVELSYDKFSFALGLNSRPQNQSSGKGSTQTLNANFNFGGNIWYIQNTLRYFKGFYDNNTGSYDTTIRQTGIYYQRPDIANTLFRTKFLYFTHHKRFAFRSGYASNYRQIRSAGTWIMSANINYYNLQADSAFLPAATRAYYGDYGSMQGLRVLGLSLNVGAAGTLVIMKGFFLNGMFILGPEQQWRKYAYGDGSSRLSYVSISGDLRFSIGFNLKRFYIMGTNTNDFVIYNSSFVGLANSSITGGFTFGWRFNSRDTPEFYKRFQKTKFYTSI